MYLTTHDDKKRRMHLKGSGGSEGGTSMFFFGLLLAVGGVYFFFDSVRVTTGHAGALSGLMGGGRGHGRLIDTTSMGILFVPFFIGVFALFVDAHRKWPWYLTYIGLAILAIEILSRIRFIIDSQADSLAGHVRDVRSRLRPDVSLLPRIEQAGPAARCRVLLNWQRAISSLLSL